MRSLVAYILKDDGRSGSVQNGVVTFSGTKKPLRYPPIGLREMKIAWDRHMQKHGINRNFTFPQDFVRDARSIIQDAFYKQTIDEKLFLLIQKLDLVLTPTTYKWIYNYLYKGELDLTTTKDGRNKLNVSIMEGGLSKLLKANENTVYDIPFDDDSVNVKMDGIILNMRQNFSSLSGFTFDENGFPFEIAFPLTKTTNDGIAPYVGFFSEQLETALISNSVFNYIVESPNYFAKIQDNAPAPISLTFAGKIKIQITTLRTVKTFRLTMWQVPLGATPVSGYVRTILFTQLISAAGAPFEYTLNQTVTAAPGDRFFFTFDRNPAASPSTLSDYEIMEGTEIHTTFNSRLATTYIKAYPWLTLFKKLVAKITGHESDAASVLLSNYPGLCITCGDAVRGISGAKIKTSLNDFFTNSDVFLMAGEGILNNKIAIEARAQFYDESAPIDLGEIKNHEVSYAADIVCNTYKTGSAEPDIEDVNGKFEFNGSTLYGSPLEKVAKELSLVSPYKSGPLDIEITRINLDGKITTDSNNDNDVYNLDCVSSSPILRTLVSFIASGNKISIVPTPLVLLAGQRLRFTGSSFNDSTYTVVSVADAIVGQQVVLSGGTLVDEGPVSVLVEIVTGLVYELNRPAFSTLETSNGPLTSTIFNLFFSPKRVLLTHGRWIHSMLFKFDNQKISMKSGTRNTTLKTVLGTVTVDEDKDENISDLGNIMFLPYYHEFETKVPFNPTTLIELLEANPNRCFQFSENGIVYKGFNIKTGMSPGDNKPQSFKLLSAPDNDLTQKIEI